MYRQNRGIRLFVRNRARYNPETEVKDLLFVDVEDYANTHIWQIKEQIKLKTASTPKLDELVHFSQVLGVQRLEDGRSVAHYNLPDGAVLETTTNPFFVASMYILAAESERKKLLQPNNRKFQAVMKKSVIHKFTIISVLFNSSKDDGDTQPDHFSCVEDFIRFIDAHPKKGAEMSHFTTDALERMFKQYVDLDIPTADPIGSFVERYARELGFRGGAAPHNAVPARNMGPPRILGNYVAGRAAQVDNNNGHILGMPVANRNQRVLGYRVPHAGLNVNNNHHGDPHIDNHGNHYRPDNNVAAPRHGNTGQQQADHRYGHHLSGNHAGRGRGRASARVKKKEARHPTNNAGRAREDCPFPGPGRQVGGKEQLSMSPTKSRAGKSVRLCENCEEAEAECYCAECEGGQVLCHQCATILHRAAAKRRHVLQAASEAPRPSKSYVPQPYRAPFAILLGLYSGHLNQNGVLMLSMTEDELKTRAQGMTDTDLSDRSPGKRFNGFDGIESMITKGLIKREATRTLTYALTDSGITLSERLLEFHGATIEFFQLHGLPTWPHDTPDSLVCGDSRVCLLVDKYEKQRERFVALAEELGITVQIRELKVCDYMWILTPPGDIDGHYDAAQPDLEIVLPHLVERKTWDDLDDSLETNRFQSQVDKMKLPAVAIVDAEELPDIPGSVVDMGIIIPRQDEHVVQRPGSPDGFDDENDLHFQLNADEDVDNVNPAVNDAPSDMNDAAGTASSSTSLDDAHDLDDIIKVSRDDDGDLEVEDLLALHHRSSSPIIPMIQHLPMNLKLNGPSRHSHHGPTCLGLDSYQRSGLQDRFYLVEGSVTNMRNKDFIRRETLKDRLERLQFADGFHVVRTCSWYKSAHWLHRMTHIIARRHREGLHGGPLRTLREVQARASGRQPPFDPGDLEGQGQTSVWTARDFVEIVFRDAEGEVSLVDASYQLLDLPPEKLPSPTQRLLIVQDVEAYMKVRQRHLNQCVTAVCSENTDTRDVVDNMLSGKLRRLVHYDVFVYWKTVLEVYLGILVVFTEGLEDTECVQAAYQAARGALAGQRTLPDFLNEAPVTRPHAVVTPKAKGKKVCLTDEELALRLHAELNGDVGKVVGIPDSVTEGHEIVANDEALALRIQKKTKRKYDVPTLNQIKPLDQSLSDEALARKLQAEFDAENSVGTVKVKVKQEVEDVIEGTIKVKQEVEDVIEGTIKFKEEAEDVIVEDSQPSSVEEWNPAEESESNDDMPTIKPRFPTNPVEVVSTQQKTPCKDCAVKSPRSSTSEDSESTARNIQLSDIEVARCLQERFDRLQEAASTSSRPVMRCSPVPRLHPVQEERDRYEWESSLKEARKACVEVTIQEVDAENSGMKNVSETQSIMSVAINDDSLEDERTGQDSEKWVVPETVCEDDLGDTLTGLSGAVSEDGLRCEQSCRLGETLVVDGGASCRGLAVVNSELPELPVSESEKYRGTFPEDCSKAMGRKESGVLPGTSQSPGISRAGDEELAIKLAGDEESLAKVIDDQEIGDKCPVKLDNNKFHVDTSRDEEYARRLAASLGRENLPVNVSLDNECSTKPFGTATLATDKDYIPVDLSHDEALARKLASETNLGDSSIDVSSDEELARRLAAAGASPEVDLLADEELARRLAMDSPPPDNTEEDVELAKRLAMELESSGKLFGVESEESAIEPEGTDQDEALARRLAAEWNEPSSSSPQTPKKSLIDEKHAQLGQLAEYRAFMKRRFSDGSPSSPSQHGLDLSGLVTPRRRGPETSTDLKNPLPPFVTPMRGSRDGGRRLVAPVSPVQRSKTQVRHGRILNVRTTSVSLQEEQQDTKHSRRPDGHLGDGQTKISPIVLDDDDDSEDEKLDKHSASKFPSHSSSSDPPPEGLVSEQQVNVTCGACQNKGHSRTFRHCPRYYSAEEVERRDKHAETRRKKTEKVQREKVQTLQQLERQREELRETHERNIDLVDDLIQKFGGKKSKKKKKDDDDEPNRKKRKR